MIKLISLIFVFVAVHSETRQCPPINAVPYHRTRTGYSADSIMETLVLNSTSMPSNLTAAVPENLSKWPKGREFDAKYEIPYSFHKDVTSRTKEAIYFGMVIIERGTNIVFIRKRKNDTSYIFFETPKNDAVCHSLVGNQQGKQIIRLASWCRAPRFVIHELLHAIGLKHEHLRADRSTSNGTWGHEQDFAPDLTLKTLTPYDPFSIMHYLLPFNTSLRAEYNWTTLDTFLAHTDRAFPSLCDYSGVNEIYKGHVQSPPCTDVKIRPMLLKPTEEGERKWEELEMNKRGYSMTWGCNWLSGMELDGVPIFSYAREERTLCQFEANSMYPEFGWIPYAEKSTYPILGLNYSEFKTFPVKVTPDWMTHDICDCLGPPPPSSAFKLTDHSMYQTCLECVHFKNTTADVLKCIAKRTKRYLPVLRYLVRTYNQTQHYLRNPDFS